MRGPVHEDGEGLACGTVEAQHGQVLVAGFGVELGVAVGIEAFQPDGAGGEPGRFARGMGFRHRAGNRIFEGRIVTQGRVELTFAAALLVCEFEDGP